MNKASLWSLRLGFSNQQALDIEKLGLEKFLTQSFKATYDSKLPYFFRRRTQNY